MFAHPDDPEVACGGTLARWAALGCEVHLVIACRGEKGSFDPSTDPDAARRQPGRRGGSGGRGAAARQRRAPRVPRRRDRERRRAAGPAHRDRPAAATGCAGGARPHRGVLRRQLREPPRPPPARLGGARHDRAGRQPALRAGGGRRPPGRAGAAVRHPRSRCLGRHRRRARPPRSPPSPATRAGSVATPSWSAELLEHRAAEEGRRAGIEHAEAFRRLRFTG